MASGFEMMMKAMGFNPSEIIAQIEYFKTGLDKFLAMARDQADLLARVERKIDELTLSVDGLKGGKTGPANLQLPDDALLERAGALHGSVVLSFPQDNSMAQSQRDAFDTSRVYSVDDPPPTPDEMRKV